MREITVKYQLSDEYGKRLEAVREKYREKGLELSVEDLFEFIMLTGSIHDIDSKLCLHESMLGLLEL